MKPSIEEHRGTIARQLKIKKKWTRIFGGNSCHLNIRTCDLKDRAVEQYTLVEDSPMLNLMYIIRQIHIILEREVPSVRNNSCLQSKLNGLACRHKLLRIIQLVNGVLIEAYLPLANPSELCTLSMSIQTPRISALGLIFAQRLIEFGE